ncbi:MAG: hypothetical protein U9R08_03930 [Nanoarchaeota archaeon]|nr:hypothetical protein [Nanoarchaeota archaeon]
MRTTRGRDYFTIEHKKLYIRGIEGTLDMPLSDISVDTIEFAPVKQEDYRTFLPGFRYGPSVDVTIVQPLNAPASVLVYTLSRGGAISSINDIIESTGMKPTSLNEEFVSAIESAMFLEEETYKMAKVIAKSQRENFGKVWSGIRYARFLKYFSLSGDEAISLACRKYNLKGLQELMSRVVN